MDWGLTCERRAERRKLGLVAWFLIRSGWAGQDGGVVVRGGLALAPQADGIVGVPPIHPLPFFAELGGDLRW